MKQISYTRHRFPPAVISMRSAYLRFTSSYRDLREMEYSRPLSGNAANVLSWREPEELRALH